MKRTFFPYFILAMVCLATNMQGAMPQTPPNKRTRAHNTTPTQKITPISNTCREAIEALKASKLNEFKRKLTNYLNTIPYTAKIPGMQNQETFFQALLWYLCSFLSGNPALLSKDNDSISAYATDDFIYVLHARAAQTNNNNQLPQKYYFTTDSEKEVKVIGISVLFHPNATSNQHAHTIKINYLDNASNMTEIALDQDDIGAESYESNPMCKAPRTLIEYLLDAAILEDKLGEILEYLPLRLHVMYEKFYQALLFCFINFFRSGYATIEEATQHGRADIIVRATHEQNLVIEFKYNGTTQEAIEQIEQRRYYQAINSGTIWQTAINIEPYQYGVIVAVEPGPTLTTEDRNNFISPMKTPTKKSKK